MKIYTFYTNSHKKLLTDFFIPSLFKYENCDLIIENHPQECVSGQYRSLNWKLSMERKLHLIIRAIENNAEKVFIYSDCDVQFFNKFIDENISAMFDCDILTQRDGQKDLCAGFMFIKSNNKTHNLFSTILKNYINFKDDQEALNYIIKQQNIDIKYNFLDSNYYNLYYALKADALKWNPYKNSLPKNMPKKINIFHANWIIGINNKIKAMELINNFYQNDQNFIIE
jgi:hypothetical protein